MTDHALKPCESISAKIDRWATQPLEDMHLDLSDLQYAVLYRRKDGAYGRWIAMAAYDVETPARLKYEEQTTDADWPWEYKLVHITTPAPAGDEVERVAGLIEQLRSLYPDLSQLLNGFADDGRYWSEWDESVRQRLIKWGGSIEVAIAAIRGAE